MAWRGRAAGQQAQALSVALFPPRITNQTLTQKTKKQKTITQQVKVGQQRLGRLLQADDHLGAVGLRQRARGIAAEGAVEGRDCLCWFVLLGAGKEVCE